MPFVEKRTSQGLLVNKWRWRSWIKIASQICPSKSIRLLLPFFINWQMLGDRNSQKRCSKKYIPLKISQISQENNCVSVCFYKKFIKLQILWKMKKSTNVYEINLVCMINSIIFKRTKEPKRMHKTNQRKLRNRRQ